VICDYEDQHVYISRNKHILAIYLAAASCSSMIVAVCYMLYILPVAFNMGYSRAAFLRITHLSPYKAAFMFRCYWSLVTLSLPLSLSLCRFNFSIAYNITPSRYRYVISSGRSSWEGRRVGISCLTASFDNSVGCIFLYYT